MSDLSQKGFVGFALGVVVGYKGVPVLVHVGYWAAIITLSVCLYRA